MDPRPLGRTRSPNSQAGASERSCTGWSSSERGGARLAASRGHCHPPSPPGRACPPVSGLPNEIYHFFSSPCVCDTCVCSVYTQMCGRACAAFPETEKSEDGSERAGQKGGRCLVTVHRFWPDSGPPCPLSCQEQHGWCPWGGISDTPGTLAGWSSPWTAPTCPPVWRQPLSALTRMVPGPPPGSCPHASPGHAPPRSEPHHPRHCLWPPWGSDCTSCTALPPSPTCCLCMSTGPLHGCALPLQHLSPDIWRPAPHLPVCAPMSPPQ